LLKWNITYLYRIDIWNVNVLSAFKVLISVKHEHSLLLLPQIALILCFVLREKIFAKLKVIILLLTEYVSKLQAD
jgi:hypothetical protein